MHHPANQSRRPSWPVPVLIGLVAAVAITLIIISSVADDSSGTSHGTMQGQPAPSDAVDPAPDGGADSSGDNAAEPADPPTSADRQETPDLSVVERRDPGDPLGIGPVDAPVTLVVFSDYQCPYCAKWSTETLPALEPYIAAGDLRLEWRDVNIFGDASERGARATYAAALQGEFTAMHGALFADGLTRSEAELSDERLSALAVELGLDGPQFDADYDSEHTRNEVGRNQSLGIELGAFSTPSFIFGGQPIVGAQPTEVFIAAMDQALAAAQNAG